MLRAAKTHRHRQIGLPSYADTQTGEALSKSIDWRLAKPKENAMERTYFTDAEARTEVGNIEQIRIRNAFASPTASELVKSVSPLLEQREPSARSTEKLLRATSQLQAFS